jgi:DNA-binding Xre family transcriptional regulator
LSRGNRKESDTLDFDVVLADDSGGRIHGGESTHGARSPLDIKKCNAPSVRREGRSANITVKLSEPGCWATVEMGEIEIGLFAGLSAIGGKGERSGVGRPSEVAFFATQNENGSGGDALAGGEVGDGSNVNLTVQNPGEALSVRRNDNFIDDAAATDSGKNLVDALRARNFRAGLLCETRLRGNGRKKRCEKDNAEPTSRRTHTGNANSKKQGAKERGSKAALGAHVADMAREPGVNQSAIHRLEKSEDTKSITLNSLEKPAGALDCKVVYAIVPRGGKTILELAERQKWKRKLGARKRLKRVSE